MPPMDTAMFVGLKDRVSAAFSGWKRREDPDPSARNPLLDNVRAVPERVRSENALMLQLFALGAALTLFPCMGPDGLLKDPTFSADYRLWVSRVFPLWWIIVCMGVPCSIWGRWQIEVQFARMTTHLGMLGISVLVIMFSQWMLALNAFGMPLFLLAVSTVFFVFWIRCCKVGDL